VTLSGGNAHAPAPVSTGWIGRLRGVGPQVQAPEAFVLAGIDWQAPEHARIELRARTLRGGWTPWVLASVLGHDSDGGETVAYALIGDPVWTGRADAVQLRTDVQVEGLSVHFVSAAVAVAAAADGAPEPLASAAGGLPLATPRLPAGPGQPPIIARSAWGAGLEPRAAPVYGDVQVAFVHHSVNANGYSSAEVPSMLRSIYQFHTFVRGWNDFGYNFAVDAYGRVWEGRAGGIDQAVVGAQAGGYNLESFGAVLLGDFEATLPTSVARAALARLVAWKLALHGVPVKGRVTVEVDPSDASYTRFRPGQLVSLPRVAGHRDGCTTDCPGDDMYFNGLPPLRASVSQLVGRQVKVTLEVGPPQDYALAPYGIAPGTKVKPARYLRLASVRLTAGRELPLHGYLRTFGGVALPKAKIRLEDVSSSRTATRELVLATALTKHDGLWFARLKPKSNLLLRALHAETPATASALIAVGVAPALSMTLTRDHGNEFTAVGTVTPDKQHVVLEAAEAGGKQRVVVRSKVDAVAGEFRSRIRLKPGRYWVTATTPADATNLAGVSPRVAAHV
jgi:hypothetical protein